MPNGAQAPTEEGEASGGESQEEEEWDSDVAEDDDDDDDDDGDEDDVEDEEEEEEEVVPSRSERRSKLVHDPSTERGKGVATVAQSTKRPQTTSPVPTEKAEAAQGGLSEADQAPAEDEGVHPHHIRVIVLLKSSYFV